MVPRIIAQTTTETTGRGMSHPRYTWTSLRSEPKTKQESFGLPIPTLLQQVVSVLLHLTPNNDDDLFAQLWRGANKLQDEYGNPRSRTKWF